MMGSIQDYQKAIETVSDYEEAFEQIIEHGGYQSLIAAAALNKHNPGLLSKLFKEQEDVKTVSED